MRRSKLSALVRSITLFASVGAPCLVQAADLLPPLPPEPLPPPIEIGGGWYLRGDVGVGATSYEKVVTTIPGQPLPPGYRVDQHSIGDQFFAGGGVGYQFGPYFHADITGEYRGGSRFGFSDSADRFDNTGKQIFDTQGKPYKGVDIYNGKLSSVVVMANGYFDLGTYFGVTPYLGAGVGSAFHTVGGFNDVGAVGSNGGYGIARDRTSNSLAWAAMAGVGYSVTPNLKLELGYRYMDLGSAKTGAVQCFNDPGCANTTYYKVKDITSHDVRLGMRWLLGGVVEAPPIYQGEPGPLVRKY